MFTANTVDTEQNPQKRIQPRQTPILQTAAPLAPAVYLHPQLELRPIFNKWSNGTDVISREGLQKILAELQPQANADDINSQTNSLFSLCDANTDNQITFEEFAAQYQSKTHHHARDYDMNDDDDVTFARRVGLKKGDRGSKAQQDDESVSLDQ